MMTLCRGTMSAPRVGRVYWNNSHVESGTGCCREQSGKELFANARLQWLV